MSRILFPVIVLFSVAVCSTASAGTTRVPQDDPDLQHALAFAADGDTIVISKGKYHGPFQAANVDDLTIRGKGKVVLQSAVGDALTITNANRLTLKNVRLRSDTGDGLFLDTVAGAEIRGVRVESASGIGIVTDASSSLHLEKCSVKNVTDGIWLIGFAGLIRKCAVRNVDGSAILLTGGGHVVERCKLSAATNGVYVAPPLSPMEHALVTENSIKDVEVGVFLTAGAIETSVTRNRIKRASDSGVRQASSTPGTVIESNKVAKCGTGIELAQDSAICTRNSVKGCTTAGISLPAAATSNVVHANRIRGGAGPHFVVDGISNSLLENDGESITGAAVNLNVLSGNFIANLILAPVRVPQDFATIQAAIDSGDGLKIVISAGDYDEALSISGSTGHALVAKGNGPVRIHGGNSPALTVNNSESVSLEGLRLDTNGADVLVMTDVRDSTVTDCRITAADDDAVVIGGGSAIRFERCVLDAKLVGVDVDSLACSWIDCDVKSGTFGMQLVGNHHLIENCTFHDNGSNALQVGHTAVTDTIGVIVRGCTITNSGNKFARFTDSAVGCLFAENRCDGSVETGITIDDSSLLHAIVRNRFDHTGGNALEVRGAPNRFDANEIRNAGLHGANTDGAINALNTWTRNVIVKSSANGFNLQGMGSILIANRASQSGGNSISDDHPDVNYRTANSFE